MKKAKNIFKKTIKHLKEDILGYKKNIKKGPKTKKELREEIKEDENLIKQIKKNKRTKSSNKKCPKKK